MVDASLSMTDRRITTRGTGVVTSDPSIATVTVEVTREGDTPGEARGAVADHVAMLCDTLSTVSDEQISTVGLTIEHDTEMFIDNFDLDYVARLELVIQCTPAAVEDVVVEVTDLGGTIDEIKFQVREEVRTTLQDEALTSAVQRARDKANTIASEEGLVVTQVLTVTTDSRDDEMDEILYSDFENSNGLKLHPDPVRIEENVEVEFGLADG